MKKKITGFLCNPVTLAGIWIILAIVAGLISKGNNYLIYKGVFWHLWEKLSLYAQYPDEYFDINHYGPFFSVVIAPFALLPVWLGKLFWSVVMTITLLVSVWHFPLKEKKRVFIYWFCANELLTALFMNQFNIVIAAIIIGAFILIEQERDTWATLLMVIGTFVKLYGIVGLAFFLFSKHKRRFVLSFIGWSAVAFLLPMLFSSPEYVVNSYVEWFYNIVGKNGENAVSLYQNISFLGMAHRITGCEFSDLYLILPGMLLFALPYLRFGEYRNLAFREAFVASVLLFVVLFSTGSESSSYIIALLGTGIWYWSAPWRRGGLDLALMIFAFILTSLSPTDLIPKYLRNEFIRPYALKALPCLLIWLKLVWEMCLMNYNQKRF